MDLDIEGVIEMIMMNDGPDGHTDGAEVIADFIKALLTGQGADWVARYEEKKTSHELARRYRGIVVTDVTEEGE